MSAFKNSTPHRKYRERAQPEAREKLGILEKKKDYKQRATNYHEKEKRLNELRLKASLKNEDEFYFRMLKGKNKDGEHIEFDSDESDIDEREYRSQLKATNQTIVTMQRSIEANKLERMKSELHLTELPKTNKHIVFVDNEEEVRQFDAATYFNTVPEMLEHRSNLLTKEQLEQQELEEAPTSTLKDRYNKLAETIEKEAKMKKMMLKLQHQRNLLSKDRRRIKKMKDGTTYRKFFIERKR